MGYIKNVVDIVVQLKRGEKGVRFVSEIYFKPMGEGKEIVSGQLGAEKI